MCTENALSSWLRITSSDPRTSLLSENTSLAIRKTLLISEDSLLSAESDPCYPRTLLDFRERRSSSKHAPFLSEDAPHELIMPRNHREHAGKWATNAPWSSGNSPWLSEIARCHLRTPRVQQKYRVMLVGKFLFFL